MTLIPAPADKRLIWYLAMEEYIGRNIGLYPEGVFFTWVVEPTVIFGRHQVIENEVNIDFCRANNIAVYRRKSGGGCVYADRGNLMLSYIVPSPHAEQVFAEYLECIAGHLVALGLDAVTTIHNDILVSSHKVSGNACYALKHGTIVHGTMLYNVDFTQLEKAITPPAEKLEKHGVQSVRQRVVNLRPLLEKQVGNRIHSIADLAVFLESRICQSQTTLSDSDLEAIDIIEKSYLYGL